VAGTNQPNQFGNTQPFRSPDPAHCAQCEIMLTDALDRTLSSEDQVLFDRHLAICPDCSRMFIDAKLGAELLDKLHGTRPEPSAALLERILSSTGPATELPFVSSAEPNTLLSYPIPAAASVPAAYGAGNVIPFRKRILNALRPQAISHTLMQPRLAMTAAMAFFSIALTLNLTGLRITQLRASDFTPSSIKRSFYDTNARVVRSINNLRVVYELESRVRDLQRDSDSNSPSAPESASPAPVQNTPSVDQNDQKPRQPEQRKQANPRQRSGSSRGLDLSRDHSPQFTASLALPDPSPRSGQESRQLFVMFTPTIFNLTEQGGHA